MKISFNKKNIVKLFNMKNRLLSIITLVSLTSGMAILGGCTQEEIDAAIAAANSLAQEQNQGQDVQQPEIEIEPEDKPVVEPEIEPEVDPVEEVNPRDYKAVYGLDFDIPVYTEEEVEQARINLDTKYENPILFKGREGVVSFEENPGYAQDYYIANQDLIYAFYNAAKDMDFRKAKASIFYDEENQIIYCISKTAEARGAIRVYFTDDGTYSQNYFPSQFEAKEYQNYNIMDSRPDNWLKVGPGSWITHDYYIGEEEINIIVNDDRPSISSDELKSYGFKYDEYTEFVAKRRDEVQKLQYK